jgi:hypothetical protein
MRSASKVQGTRRECVAARKGVSKRLQHSLLGAVFDLMLSAGLDEREIREAINVSLSRLQRRVRKEGAGKGGSYRALSDISADLLRVWHRDGRYLDEDRACPRPLHAVDGNRSLRSIIRSLDPKAKVRDVVEFLVDSGLIRRLPGGKYLPMNDVGMISHVDRFVVEHLVKSVNRLAGTIRRNSKLGHQKGPLIERFAYVSDLDPGEVDAFREFTTSQGHSYLQVVDDWMERRRVGIKGRASGKRRPGVMAGVHVVAFLGDHAAGSGRSVVSKRKGCEGSDFRGE